MSLLDEHDCLCKGCITVWQSTLMIRILILLQILNFKWLMDVSGTNLMCSTCVISGPSREFALTLFSMILQLDFATEHVTVYLWDLLMPLTLVLIFSGFYQDPRVETSCFDFGLSCIGVYINKNTQYVNGTRCKQMHPFFVFGFKMDLSIFSESHFWFCITTVGFAHPPPLLCRHFACWFWCFILG